MYAFDIKQPHDVVTAVDCAKADADNKFLAGGQTLIPVMKQRLAMPAALVDLNGVDALSGIDAGGDTVVIKAMTRHADVAAHPDVRAAIPALAKLAGGIGDPHVRNRGTIGGSLANSDPAADYPAAVLGLGAKIVTDRREIAADDYFLGMFETALEEGELITHVVFPIPEIAGYVKLAHPATRFALVGVLVAKTAHGVRVAVTGAGPCVFRVPDMEEELTLSFTPDAIKDGVVAADDLNNDIHASREYRAHLVSVIARRAVEAALG